MSRYALIIGIAHYNNFSNLPKAAADASEVAQIFKVQGGYEVELLPKRLVADNTWDISQDKRVTGSDLGLALRTFLLEKAAGHEALIYFAGHGFEVSNVLGSKRGYLAASDCSTDNYSHAISFGDLNDLIQQSSLSSLVLILDCCNAGSFLERTLIESTLTVFSKKKDYYFITACRSFERAREGLEHGIFTDALLRGLKRDNADNDGSVTADRLFDFIRQELMNSGQEPIRTGLGKSITLVKYHQLLTTRSKQAIVDYNGEEICPYQGLQVFTADHKQFFFGRDRVVEEIRQKLEQHSVVLLIGASGSGKSSIVQAGLLPLLLENGWQSIGLFKPGFEPLEALKCIFEPFFKRSKVEIQALHHLIMSAPDGLSCVLKRLPGARKRLLVVDQFEEIFTICINETQRQRFFTLLTQAAEIPNHSLTIICTIRADFLESFLRYSSLHSLIQSQSLFILPSLSSLELRDIIIKPAKRQDYSIDEGLLVKILEDVGKEPGFLPLLEFSLTKLWERRDQVKRLLTLTQYEEIGGLSGAINLYAEKVYCYRDYREEQPTEEREELEKDWIRRIFLRLVRTGQESNDTRQRQRKDKLSSIAKKKYQGEFDELLNGEDGLVQSRLLVAGRDGQEAGWIDLAHEALMQSWQRFAKWRQENRDLYRLNDRLEDSVKEWQKNFDDNNLLMGGLLILVKENWQGLEALGLDVSTKQFYKRSVLYEQNRINQLQTTLDEALKQRIKAEKNEIKAICQTSQSLFISNQEFDALLEALKAGLKLKNASWFEPNISSQIQVISMLQQSTCWVRERNRLEGHVGGVVGVKFSPSGQVVASTSTDKTIKLWQLDGTMLKTFVGHTEEVRDISFHPIKQILVSASIDKTLRIWDLDGNLIKTLMGHTAGIIAVSFSPDGQVLASADWDGILRLWNSDGSTLRSIATHQDSLRGINFSPDGQVLASAGSDGTIKIWRLSGELLAVLRGHTQDVRAISFSPNGQMLASASADNTVRLWQINGTLLVTLVGHSGPVWAVNFSPNGQMLASASWDRTVRLWRIDGTLLKVLSGHASKVVSVSFSPNGQMLASASWDGSVRLWQINNFLVEHLVGHTAGVTSVRFSSDSRKIASASWDSTVRLWLLDGTPLKTILNQHVEPQVGKTHLWVRFVCFSPNDKLIASAGEDHTIKIWNIDGDLIRVIIGHTNTVLSLCFSLDGQIITSASADKTIKIWHIDGTLLTTILGHNGSVTSVCFSPNSEIIVSASADNTIKIWRLDGTLITSIAAHTAGVESICFSPNGEIIASASADGTVKLWRLDGTLISTIIGHTAGVMSICFSPNGRMLASASTDKTVRLWQLDDMSLIIIIGHTAGVESIAFSPDGQMIVSADQSGNILVWKVSDFNDDILTNLLRHGFDWVQDYLRTNLRINGSNHDFFDMDEFSYPD